jgi:hypothetical protein
VGVSNCTAPPCEGVARAIEPDAVAANRAMTAKAGTNLWRNGI